ncbi:MAG: ion channel DMI1 [Pseudohongiellaceae bacterium]|nr:ion channel DMI1 [Pseudohongiellaceae bacterium]
MFRLRFADRLKYFVERQFVKGAHYQLLVVIALIALISLLGGALVLPTGQVETETGAAVWWAFLRLTDPGYLGDDVGTWPRIVSTILTVIGYVLFMGTLVAIITRWLISVMQQLERGLTPVAVRNHVVILGWTSRTTPLVRELICAESRVERFLLAHSTKRLRVVVLSEEASATQLQLLKSEPGIGRNAHDIILRSGSALEAKALHRAACLNAAAIIVPGHSHGHQANEVSADIETIKALLSINSQAVASGNELPYVVAEIEDVRRKPTLHRAYSGPMEVIASDATVSRLLAQNILHPGLSSVYSEVLNSSIGNELYLRKAEAFGVGAQTTLGDVASLCPNAIVLGFLRLQGEQWEVFLNVASDTILQSSDNLVFLAQDYKDTEPVEAARRLGLITRPARSESPADTVAKMPKPMRILLVGWNRRVPALISELASYEDYRFEVMLVSTVSSERREQQIAHYSSNNAKVSCEFLQVDYMIEGELRKLNPASYDSVLMLCSDRIVSGEEADARTVVGYLVLDEILQQAPQRPQVVMELNDPSNESLLVLDRSEVLISPLIMSHLLSQVALRRELTHVFDDLFTSRGAEISFHDPRLYSDASTMSFADLEALVAAKGETALGIYRFEPRAGEKQLQLNPKRNSQIALGVKDKVVVLSTVH